jgi:DNA-binding Lrp family transcriptional regulator
MSTVWDLQAETHTQKLVLLALADNANDESGCWPAIGTIAKKCNLSPQGVRDQIDRLEELGLLTLEHRFTKEGRQTSNFYRLHLHVGRVNGVEGEGQPGVGGRVNAVDPNHHKEPSLKKERRKSLSNASQAEGEKRQRECHEAYVKATGHQVRYDLHLKLWRVFDQAGYSAQNVRDVVSAKKAWNSKRPDCPKSLDISKLIGDLSKFDEELAKFHRQVPYTKTVQQRITQERVNLPPVAEFKAGISQMRKAIE